MSISNLEMDWNLKTTSTEVFVSVCVISFLGFWEVSVHILYVTHTQMDRTVVNLSVLYNANKSNKIK